MNVLRALDETFWNFISTVVSLDYHDYIDETWNISENVYRSYKIFTTEIFAQIAKIFKQSTIRYIKKDIR